MKTSRAALLPSPGDPFLLLYWFGFFERFWQDEVDKLYIYYNSPIEKAVADWVQSVITKNSKVNWQYLPNFSDHGPAINRMLEICEEEHIVLLEDDTFIFRQGLLNGYFNLIETRDFDIIGSQRGCISQQVLAAAGQKFGKEVVEDNGFGDAGVGFWPTMFFTAKENLLATDRHFGAKAWNEGDFIEELGITIDAPTSGDTFVWTSIQLLAKKLKFATIRSCHGRGEDILHWKSNQNIFDGQCSYVHIGSLSSGISGFLLDDQGRSLSNRSQPEALPKSLPDFGRNVSEVWEIERRLQWWARSLDFCEKKYKFPKEVAEFAKQYRGAINRAMGHYLIHPKSILQRQVAYNELMGDF